MRDDRDPSAARDPSGKPASAGDASLVQLREGPVISPDARLKIENAIKRFPQKRSALLPGLWIIQDELGWVPPEAMEEIADLLDLEPVQVEETASFYSMYFKKPVGRVVVDVCTNIACMLRGGYELSKAVQERYGIKPGETSADGRITLREVECIAACDRAPAAQINYEYYENLTGESLIRSVDSLAASAVDVQKNANAGQTDAIQVASTQVKGGN